MKTALFFFVLAFSDLSHALYGAKAVTDARLDAVVSLHLDDPENSDYDYFCSGVLISPTKILTAGHCIDGMGIEVYDDSDYFVYFPDFLKVKIKGSRLKVKSVTFAPTYYEYAGLEGEDLALIELAQDVKNVKPLKIASRQLLVVGASVSLVARGKKADTKIKSLETYNGNLVIETDGAKSGVCAGDSGGALVLEKNGEPWLAGILRVDSEGCKPKNTLSVFPRAQF